MPVQLTTRAAELASLRTTVREICQAAGVTTVRDLPSAGRDEPSWDLIGRQVGLAALGLPEEAGGAGGLAEIAVVAEELGRVLLPVPFLSSTVLTGQVLAACGASDALASVASGAPYALAALGSQGTWEPKDVSIGAERGADAWVLNGNAEHVLDGAGATGFVVAALTEDGPDLFLVSADAAGASVVPLPTLDLSRSQSRLVLEEASSVRLTFDGSAGHALAGAVDVAAVALAAEQLGGAEACLELTVAYVGQRRQFGRSIGSFQAIKHTLADLLVLVETCRSAVATAVESPGPVSASVAKAWCSDAFRTVTSETIQLHGGIGFTWEHDAHLYFRRARADAALLGSAAHHRERIAELLQW